MPCGCSLIYLEQYALALDRPSCHASGMSDLWEHRKGGRNDSSVFCNCTRGNRRQAGEREEEKGFCKEHPVGCESGGRKQGIFISPVPAEELRRRWKSQ